MPQGLFDQYEHEVAARVDVAAARESRRAEFAANLKKRKLAQIPTDPHGQQLLTGLPHLHGERRVIMNAETTGLGWWDRDRAIGWSWWLPESGRRGYIPLRHECGENVPVEAFRAWQRGELVGTDLSNINTKFDLHTSEADGVNLRELCRSFGDVQHQAALLDDERYRFNLDQLTYDFLGIDTNQPQEIYGTTGKLPSSIKSELEFRYLHPSIVAPYAVRNVHQVHDLEQAFAPRIAEEELEEVLQLERDIIPVVVEMEHNGLYLDLPLLERWKHEVAERVDAVKMKIWKETGLEFTSFDSNKQMAELFRRRGIAPTLFTETGLPSFTDGVMKVAAAGDPLIADAREGGQLADLLSKYLVKYSDTVRSDGWIRFNLHQLRNAKDENTDDVRGAVSGRFSAAGDKQGGFNPQQVVAVEKQLERGWCPDYVIRKLFVPGPDEWDLFASDMMQVEYRLFAHYANDPAINAAYGGEPKQKLINGKPVWIQGPLADFHALVAELLNQPHLNRKLVKNVNFALIYGAALVKFAYMLGLITEAVYKELTAKLMAARKAEDYAAIREVYKDSRLESADAILRTYHNTFPRVKPLMDQTKDVARTRGYVKDLVGRRARLTGRYHSALNRIVQGGAASINKRVLAEVYKQRHDLGVRMRLTVHDELVCGLLKGANLDRIDKVLNTQYYDLRVPILWESKHGPNWAACK